MIISVLSISQPVEAVSGSMTLRASTNTLYANQTLTVTVGLSAPVDVGSFDCILTFNSNLLRYKMVRENLDFKAPCQKCYINVSFHR